MEQPQMIEPEREKHCLVAGCNGVGHLWKKTGKRYLVKGYCDKHYQRWKKYGDPYVMFIPQREGRQDAMTTPNSFDDELDGFKRQLTLLIADEFGSVSTSFVEDLLAIILTHRNAELEKLLEQKVENMQTTDDRFIDAVPVSAIKDLMRGNDV